MPFPVDWFVSQVSSGGSEYGGLATAIIPEVDTSNACTLPHLTDHTCPTNKGIT